MKGTNSPFKSHQTVGDYNRGQISAIERRLQSFLDRTDKQVDILMEDEGDYISIYKVVPLGEFDPTQEVRIYQLETIINPAPDGYDWVTYPVNLDRVMQALNLPAYSVPKSLIHGMGWVGGFVQRPIRFTEDGKPIFDETPESEEESIESLLTKEVVET